MTVRRSEGQPPAASVLEPHRMHLPVPPPCNSWLALCVPLSLSRSACAALSCPCRHSSSPAACSAAGTLTPIVSNPDLAVMSEAAREAVRSVAQLFPTAVISGRGREKVQQFVRLRELYYAGSHGMDIVGPSVGSSAGPSAHSVADAATAADGSLAFQPAAAFAPLVDAVHGELEQGVAAIPGATVEHNKFCVSVHFRNCAPDDYPAGAWVATCVCVWWVCG